MPTQKKNDFDIESKGYELPPIRPVPKELKYVEKEPANIPSLSFWEKLKLWIKPIFDYSLQKIGSSIIPRWFFWGILAVLLIIGLVWVL